MKLFLKKNHIFLLLVLIYTPLFEYFIDINNKKGHPYQTADWLISYNHGFIKRGFLGTFFLSLTEDANLLLDILSFSLISVYLFIFICINKIFKNNNQTFLSYILIFSPATFLFPIYDSQGSFRKEIIGMLSLLVLSAMIKSKNRYIPLSISSLIYVVGIFSHSVNVFFLTTLLAVLFFFYKSKKIYDYCLFIVPTLLYLVLYFWFSNLDQNLYAIREKQCLDLRIMGLGNLCGKGAFEALVWDSNANYLITQNETINVNRSLYYFYVVLFLISFLPLILDKNIKRNILIYIGLGISFIPLFFYAFDWGRWIYIISICFLTIYLLSEKKQIQTNFIYLLIFYPFLFRIEHCCKINFDFSFYYFINNFKYIIDNFINIFI